MSSIHFSNFRIDKGTDYFLYIGELKNYGLNYFLKTALNKNFDRKFDFIAIVPDILEQYNYANIIVINPFHETCEYPFHVHCRISAKKFMSGVSKAPEIRRLIEKLLLSQSHVFLYMYESLVEMTLDDIPGVSILGPDKYIAKKANNKSFQMQSLKGIAPVVDFRTCHNYDELIRTTETLWDKWTDGIFVTKEYSAAGINSIVANSKNDIVSKFNKEEAPYLITRFVPHRHDPTVLGVVANENDVFIAGIADQRIENGNQFTGSTYPSALSDSVKNQLVNHTRKAGAWLSRQGYRGIFGCDYIVTDTGDIRFLEINARKQGTTLEFCCTLEQLLPAGSPNLPEIEYFAVIENRQPDNTCEVILPKKDIFWGTYNYKVHESVKTTSYIPQGTGERESFKKVADGRLKKDYLILEHVGADFVIAEGSFLARVVALGHNHTSVIQGIAQGCKTIETTFIQ